MDSPISDVEKTLYGIPIITSYFSYMHITDTRIFGQVPIPSCRIGLRDEKR
jgi:hypothetical protein